MPITQAQQSALAGASTKPITLVRWEHSGVMELLSCSGAVTFNGEAYTPGGVNVSSISDGRSARLEIPSSPSRNMEVLNGNWRNGVCQIYAIPATPGDSGIYTSEQGILQLDGMIQSSRLSGDTVSISVIHRFATGNTPRNTLDEIANYIPAPGTILVWEGDELVLEARR